MIYDDDDMADAATDPDDEFEAKRSAAQKEIDDAENDLLLAQLLGRGSRDARKKLRVAKASLAALEDDWLNEHCFDMIAT